MLKCPTRLLTSRGQAQIRSAAAIRSTKGGEMTGSIEAIPDFRGDLRCCSLASGLDVVSASMRLRVPSCYRIGNGAVVIGGSLLYGRGTRTSIVPNSGGGIGQAGCLPHSDRCGRLDGSIQGTKSRSKVQMSRSSLVRQVRFSTCACDMHSDPKCVGKCTRKGTAVDPTRIAHGQANHMTGSPVEQDSAL